MNAPLHQTQLGPTYSQQSPKNNSSRTATKTETRSTAKLELLLILEANIRKVDTLKELRYLLANDSKILVACDQILLHRVDKNGKLKDIETVSSIATLEADAPILLWLNKNIGKQYKDVETGAQTFAIPVSKAPGGVYPFSYILHVPFTDRKDDPIGAISFLKETPFGEKEIAYSKRIAATASHAMLALTPKRFSAEKFRSKPFAIVVFILVLIALFIPVPLTILAPAEIVAHRPAIVTAPLQGVIEHIAVQPNMTVKKGDILFSLNKINLQSAFNVAERKVAIADARYRRATQGAFKSADSKRELAITKAEYQMAIAEKNNAASRLSLSDIVAKKDGIILFQGHEKWLGKPVETGERIMRIADPNYIRFKIDVDAADSIILEEGADVKIFLDSAPLRPVSAIIETRSYEAEFSNRSSFIFPMVAKIIEIKNSQPRAGLRIGLRGTAQIYGKKEPLWFFLFRKPISAVRQFIGY